MLVCLSAPHQQRAVLPQSALSWATGIKEFQGCRKGLFSPPFPAFCSLDNGSDDVRSLTDARGACAGFACVFDGGQVCQDDFSCFVPVASVLPTCTRDAPRKRRERVCWNHELAQRKTCLLGGRVSPLAQTRGEVEANVLPQRAEYLNACLAGQQNGSSAFVLAVCQWVAFASKQRRKCFDTFAKAGVSIHLNAQLLAVMQFTLTSFLKQ